MEEEAVEAIAPEAVEALGIPIEEVVEGDLGGPEVEVTVEDSVAEEGVVGVAMVAPNRLAGKATGPAPMLTAGIPTLAGELSATVAEYLVLKELAAVAVLDLEVGQVTEIEVAEAVEIEEDSVEEEEGIAAVVVVDLEVAEGAVEIGEDSVEEGEEIEVVVAEAVEVVAQ